MPRPLSPVATCSRTNSVASGFIFSSSINGIRSGKVLIDHQLIRQAREILQESGPAKALEWGFNSFDDRLTVATGFGAEGIALIDMALRINSRVDIFFLDTAFLFPETYELRRRIEDLYGIRIRAVRAGLTPDNQEQIYGSALWDRDPDLCCRLRKLEPLELALEG